MQRHHKTSATGSSAANCCGHHVTTGTSGHHREIPQIDPSPSTSTFDIEHWLNATPDGSSSEQTSKLQETVMLSDEHKKIIKTTWPALHQYMTRSDDTTNSHHTDLQQHQQQKTHQTQQLTQPIAATEIFLRIFDVSPGIRRVFGYGAPETDEVLQHDERLAAHARRFIDAIAAVTDNLDSLDTRIASAFVNLGRHHIQFRDIEEGHFDVFSGAFMYVCRQALRDQFTDGVSVAWRRLFDFMLQHLQFGYRLARAAANSTGTTKTEDNF